MSLSTEYLSASFRGVGFLVPRESKAAGKKTVSHEYPNAKKRFVEELGEQAATYSINAIIVGANSIQNRINLERALTKSGRGLLIHPSLGQLMVVATTFSSDSSDGEVGQFSFSITFEESEENISLTPTVTGNQLVSSLAGSAKLSLDAAFKSVFSNNGFSDLIIDNAEQLTDVSELLGGSFDGVSGLVSENLSVFKSSLTSFANNALVTARNGTSIADGLRGIYDKLDEISPQIGEFYEGFKDLTGYNLDRVAKPLTTAKRILEELNLSSIDDHTRLNGLVSAYEAATYKEYETDQELLAVKTELDESYDSLVERAKEDSIAYNIDFRDDINALRNKARESFELKAVNAWRVVDIDAGESSLSNISYRYYESLDQVDTILKLNPNINAAESDGAIIGLS